MQHDNAKEAEIPLNTFQPVSPSVSEKYGTKTVDGNNGFIGHYTNLKRNVSPFVESEANSPPYVRQQPPHASEEAIGIVETLSTKESVREDADEEFEDKDAEPQDAYTIQAAAILNIPYEQESMKPFVKKILKPGGESPSELKRAASPAMVETLAALKQLREAFAVKSPTGVSVPQAPMTSITVPDVLASDKATIVEDPAKLIGDNGALSPVRRIKRRQAQSSLPHASKVPQASTSLHRSAPDVSNSLRVDSARVYKALVEARSPVTQTQKSPANHDIDSQDTQKQVDTTSHNKINSVDCDIEAKTPTRQCSESVERKILTGKNAPKRESSREEPTRQATKKQSIPLPSQEPNHQSESVLREVRALKDALARSEKARAADRAALDEIKRHMTSRQEHDPHIDAGKEISTVAKVKVIEYDGEGSDEKRDEDTAVTAATKGAAAALMLFGDGEDDTEDNDVVIRGESSASELPSKEMKKPWGNASYHIVRNVSKDFDIIFSALCFP